jgi:hypothetical protein
MTYTRRDFLIAAGATASSLIVPHVANAFDLPRNGTLSPLLGWCDYRHVARWRHLPEMCFSI